MSDATKAVFLSYAREDAPAATRIADALRGFGVEVWFDQSELRGGDQWDAKIRGQIKSCALFIPVISATTRSRDEAYFRLEWKLADDRSHLMAPGKVFVVPVVIDATPEYGAAVPESFNRAQWTRLADGLPSTAFIEQVKRLLDPTAATAGRDLRGPSGTAQGPGSGERPAQGASGAAATVGRGLPGLRSLGEVGRTPVGSAQGLSSVERPPFGAEAGYGDPALQEQKKRFPVWVVGALAAVAIGVVAAVMVLRKTEPAAGTAQPAPSGSDLLATRSSPGLSSSNGLPATVLAAAAADKSIAVLPFANLSAEKENEFFADGVHDDIITNLAKIRDLKVISRTSVLAYRDTAARNLRKIAAELGVATVLEGSVRRAGNQVRVTAQLINATTDEHLWAETYDGELTDIFGLQARLAREIATALKATLTPGEQVLINRRPTQNQEAYDLYLRARAMHQEVGERGGLTDYPRIISVYEEAIAKDPTFALAHAQVSTVHSIMYWFGALDPTPRRAEQMKAAVDAAVRLAPDAPETHLALGAYHYRVELNWPAALAEFKLAEKDLPNDAQLSFWLAITNRRLGRWTESIAHFERSVGLNPRDFAAVQNYSSFLLSLRRWDQAGQAVTRFLTYFPGEESLLLNRAYWQFERSGDREAWIRAFEALPPGNSDPSGMGRKVFVATLRGDLAAADRILADLSPVLPVDDPWSNNSVVADPAAMLRARLAFLRGDGEAVRRHSAEAVAYYRDGRWNTRQRPWVRLRLAEAAALAGRAEEAIREAEGALADMTAQDLFDATTIRQDLGTVYLVLGRKENALAVLRQLMIEPCNLGPQALRAHPLWSRLQDDPRFEEILRSAKAL